jgi:hypothetical protein
MPGRAGTSSTEPGDNGPQVELGVQRISVPLSGQVSTRFSMASDFEPGWQRSGSRVFGQTARHMSTMDKFAAADAAWQLRQVLRLPGVRRCWVPSGSCIPYPYFAAP